MESNDADRLVELLSAYLDGETDDRERAYVECLLKEDADANATLESLRATSEAIGELPRHQAPSSIEQDVLHRLERRDLLTGLGEASPSAPGRWSGLTAFTAFAAIVGLVVISALLYYSDWNEWSTRPEELATRKIAQAEPSAPTHALRAHPSPDKASLDEKLSQGVRLASLRSHPFDNESVRLRVEVGDRAEENALSARLVSRLVKQHAINLNSVAAGDKSADATTAFYLHGQPSVNYPEGDQSQILVHVPASMLDGLMDVITDGTNTTKKITLAAGGLVFRGDQSTRATLRQLSTKSPSKTDKVAEGGLFKQLADASIESDQPIPHAAPKEARRGSGMFDDMLKAVGIPDTLLEQDAPAKSPETKPGHALAPEIDRNEPTDRTLTLERSSPPPTATHLNAIRGTVDHAYRDKKTALDSKTIAPVLSEVQRQPGLVARRRRAIKKDVLHSAGAPAATSKTRVRKTKTAQTSRARATLSKADRTRLSETPEKLITLVIQLVPRPQKAKSRTIKPPSDMKKPAKSDTGVQPHGAVTPPKTKKGIPKPFG